MTIDGIEVESENGYLVIKNVQDADLLSKSISRYTIHEIHEFCKTLNFNSAFMFLDEQNTTAEGLTSMEEMQVFLKGMEEQGYFNSEANELTYPFSNTIWHNLLNYSGIIKIGDKIFRFFGEDKLYNEDNKLAKLLAVKSEDDYNVNNISIMNEYFPVLKSLTVTAPACLLSQNQEDGWETNYDDGPVETSNSQYRIKARMLFSCDAVVNTNFFLAEYKCQKKTLGIWLGKPDVIKFIFHHRVFGGNAANDSASKFHAVLDYHNSSVVWETPGEFWHYEDYFYEESYLGIPYSSYITPVCTQSSHQYWNSYVTNRSWMTIHD